MTYSDNLSLDLPSGESGTETYRFSHNAMATVFEIIAVHEDPDYAEKCVHEAFAELDRLEQELSRFVENSDISRINNSEAGQPVRVGIDTFDCLEKCTGLRSSTKRAFDIVHRGSNRSDENLETTTLDLNRDDFTVARKHNEDYLDLGGFGKGYAVDRMAEILSEWDICIALINGGMSSILALDPPPGETGWRITLRNPQNRDHVITEMSLNNRSVSGSGVRKGMHIFDPKTGDPITDRYAAWACADSAALSDGLSTAFMVMDTEDISGYCRDNDNTQGIVLIKEDVKDKVLGFGNVEIF
ncbi:MAG: FAD:protein FMN transferase [bacterium]|nr:FAD:protein FMN transferase [bacterium]